MMRIQYCSDLHLEFEKNSKYLEVRPLEVAGDVLLLAGDVIPLHDEFFNNSFFGFISRNYKQVFWVPGNHEFYYKDISDYSKSYNISLRSNINIVHNAEVELGGVNFVFSTLWSRISEANERTIEQSVSDFDCITNKGRKFNAADFNELHRESLSFIKESLKKKRGKTVVMTHHMPSALCNSKIHNDSPINEAFCVDLTDYIEGCGAEFWIYGHSHFNQKPIYRGKTLMLTNQLGYVHNNEHGSFRRNAYFAI